jgi:tetratricopeptide (TPR) repeat protein
MSYPTRFLMVGLLLAAAQARSTAALAQDDSPSQSVVPAAAISDESPAEFSKRVERLIEQMGDRRFTVRERAHAELAEIGAPAFDALTAAQSHRDLEVAHRARLLVQSIRMEWVRESDSDEIRKLLEDYDSLPDSERRNRIEQLARKPQAEGLAALCRLVRFERSVLLSKQAALAVIDQPRPTDSAWPQRSRIIQAETALSQRPAVRWLRAYAEFPTQPDAALAAWESFVADEAQQTKALPTHDQRAIQAGLLRQQVIMLLARKEQDKALAAMQRMLDLEDNDGESLARLIEWVIRQEAWPLVDEVAKRFDRQLADDPYLIYLIAQAHETRGDSKRAAEMAGKALEQQPGNPGHHLQIAYRLQQQGMAKWAEGEYRKAIEDDPEGRYYEVARSILAELLNDYERFGEAAKLLEEVAQKMQEPRRRGRRGDNMLERNPDQVKARMHFFRGKQFAVEKQTDKQVEQLQLALKHDPVEADVLIALYRISDRPQAEHERTKERIRAAAAQFRQKVSTAPDDANAMNQYAWLVANTEGDLDEATRLSQRSIELRPDAGGYIDTLAHCYAAKKDYETAVKHQTRAMELEPHSQEIKRAYDRFKRLRDEQATMDKAGKEK